MQNKYITLCWLVIVGIVVSGCGLQPINMVREVVLTTSDSSNNHKPLDVDIILISDERLIALLKNVTIEQWFADKDALIKRFDIKEQAIKSFKLLPASKTIISVDLAKSEKIAVFANYSHTKNKMANFYDASGIEGIEFNKRSYNLVL